MLAPSHGLTTTMASGIGSGIRMNKGLKSDDHHSSSTKGDVGPGINISRRISSHSEECGLIEEESQTWDRPRQSPKISV